MFLGVNDMGCCIYGNSLQGDKMNNYIPDSWYEPIDDNWEEEERILDEKTEQLIDEYMDEKE